VFTAARATKVETGTSAVGVALLLAEFHVQPRVEQPTENRPHDGQGVEIGDTPRCPDVADPDLGLDGTRPVDDPDKSFADGAGVDDRAGGSGARSCVPAAKQPLRDRGDIDPGEVPADDEGGPGRIEPTLVRGAEPARRQRGHCFARSAGRPMVGRRRLVDRLGEGLIGTAARVGPCLEQVVESLVPEPLDFRWREGRVEDDLGEERERRLQASCRDVDADAHRVPAGLGVERRAEPLARLDEGDRVVLFGPFGQRPGSEDRGTGVGRRLVGGAVADHEGRGNQWSPRKVGQDDPQAVTELETLDRGELVRSRGSGRRTGRDDLAPSGRHAATSSDSLSPRSAAESAGGCSGRYVRTIRLSARKTAALAAWMSAAVTAR